MIRGQRWFVLAVALAVLVRISVFIVAARHPIAADNGVLISPSLATGGDSSFYRHWRNQLFPQSGRQAPFVDPYANFHKMIAGPVFPALLFIFKYEDGNSWPLATLFLSGGIVLAVSWLIWFQRRGLLPACLLLFAILPHPIYYILCVGTELPFSIFFSGFFFAYFGSVQDRRRTCLWVAMLLLILLTRPNGLSVLAFVLLDILIRRSRGRRSTSPLLVPALLLAGAFFAYLFFPYFTTVLHQTAPLLFFGLPAGHYYAGLFPALPVWLNHLCSWGALFGAKLLYFLGLRPSYSHVWIGYVIARSIPGLIFLIGLAYLFVRGEAQHKLLVALFMLPILLVASQDRYGVPIQPILFFYFAKALEAPIRPFQARDRPVGNGLAQTS